MGCGGKRLEASKMEKSVPLVLCFFDDEEQMCLTLTGKQTQNSPTACSGQTVPRNDLDVFGSPNEAVALWKTDQAYAILDVERGQK